MLPATEKSGNPGYNALFLSALGDLSLSLPERWPKEYLRKGSEQARRADSPVILAGVLNNLGNAYAADGDHQKAVATYEECLRITEKSERMNGLRSKALTNLAHARLLSEVDEAESVNALNLAFQHISDTPDSFHKVLTLISLGLVVQKAENDSCRSLAYQALEAARQISENLNDASLMSLSCGYLGQLCEADARHSDALAQTRKAVFWAQQKNAPEILYQWQWQLGRLFNVLGETDKSARAYQDAVATLNPIRTVKLLGSKKGAFEELIRQFEKPEDREERKKKELKADEYGLLYALAAGYDPKAIADKEGKNFVQEWVNQITGEIAYTDEYHPAPQQRAAFLLAHMQKISNKLYLFHFGIRLYQLGRYEEALDFLNAFQNEFPCREVFNNIGLVHYQLALNALATYDQDRAYRYKLSGILDTETRAEKLVRRNLLSEKEARESFRKHVKDAIAYFEKACEKDVSYIPAKVNLSSAYILKENYAMALKIGMGSPEAWNNHAIAMYLFQKSVNVDFTVQTIRELQNLIREHPNHSDGFYNLGRILSEHGRMSEARAAWFIALYVQIPDTTTKGLSVIL